MTSHVYQDLRVVATSHNLRALLRSAARFGGAKRIILQRKAGNERAAVMRVEYIYPGTFAETEFASYQHAVEWAVRKSVRPGTWFSGCAITAPFVALDDMTVGYLDAALWSSTDEHGLPLDQMAGLDDCSPEVRMAAVLDCANFFTANRAVIRRTLPKYGYRDDAENLAALGHDFWLTRNGHGAGFWDRGFKRDGDILSDAAKLCGGIDLTFQDGVIVC